MVINLKDTLQSWELSESGTWQRMAPGRRPVSAHEYFMTNPSLSGRGTALHGPTPVIAGVPSPVAGVVAVGVTRRRQDRVNQD
jgi:polyphosphate kinase